MATSIKKVTNKVTSQMSDIQSKIGESVNKQKIQVSSSNDAVKSWSTITPIEVKKPTVLNLKKAEPSITQTTTTTPTITPVSQSTISWPNLLGKTVLRKSATPDLLSTQTEEKDIKNTTMPLDIIRASINVWWQVAKTVANNLYEQWLDWINDKIWKLEDTRQNINKAVWSFAIDMFKWVSEDISNQWTWWEWIGMVRDTVANTIEWLPRWITRVEYWLAELLDWGIDADWLTKAKENIKSNLDYWENTRVYKKVKETESFEDFLKNPTMYAWWTLSEMQETYVHCPIQLLEQLHNSPPYCARQQTSNIPASL